MSSAMSLAPALAVSLETVPLLWVTLPFVVGFSIYLLPQLDRFLALLMALTSLVYGLFLLGSPSSVLTLQLLDRFGVTLTIDSLSGYFIATNALVTMAVILYHGFKSRPKSKEAFFYTQTVILHGSLNAVFICADFISLYVALEVISIAGFLLVSYARTDRSIWVGLRYLFVSNTAMLFYLIGVILVYQSNQSFAFAGLGGAPAEAIALIFLGLLTKGGVFISGLWLPLTHSEAEASVSAMLSGVVVQAGIFPLVRCALMFPELGVGIRLLGLGTALWGVGYAIVERDTKRMLAWSTISQAGFVLVAPAVAGFYALTHGLAKATLFLLAGNLPSRDLSVLQQQPISRSQWLPLAIASLSLAGCPLLAGFGSKVLTLEQLSGIPLWVMNLTAVGTAIVAAKFIFLPFSALPPEPPEKRLTSSFRWALTPLLAGLVLASAFYPEAYKSESLFKSLATLGAGGLLYGLIFRRFTPKLPRLLEQFDHLAGMMMIILTLLFGLLVGQELI